MKKVIINSILLMFLFSGCAKQLQSSDYPIKVAWNDLSYSISVKEVSKEELGNQIGEVKRQKKPMPLENGDANFVTVGSKNFKIKGTDIKNAIAIEIEGKTYEATKNRSLK